MCGQDSHLIRLLDLNFLIPCFPVAQYSVENRLRAITMTISEVNLMSSKKENSSAKHNQSNLGKSVCNGSINMRYSTNSSFLCTLCNLKCSLFSFSLNCSTSSTAVGASNKTPRRGNETSFTSKTPKMTQGPTLGKPNSWKSPGVGGVANRPKSQTSLGDRMVPSRSTTDFEAAHHKLTSTDESNGDRVLSYQTAQIPKPQEAYINHQKV